jgi:2-amino-4-hydroxy-6-hydroxymethyldihydropteridine diphosphokinase
MTRFVVAVGSNLGSRLALVRAAAGRLHAMEDLTLEAVARPRRSVALVAPGDPPGPDFLNGAFDVSTSASPETLLDRLLELEVELGRARHRRWAARTLDLDLLVHEGEPVDSPRLRLPHPELEARSFARAALVDLGWRPSAPEAPPLAPPPTVERSPGALLVRALDGADALALALTSGLPTGPYQPVEVSTPAAFVAAAAERGAGAAVVFELAAGGVRGALAPTADPPRAWTLERLGADECRLRRAE